MSQGSREPDQPEEEPSSPSNSQDGLLQLVRPLHIPGSSGVHRRRVLQLCSGPCSGPHRVCDLIGLPAQPTYIVWSVWQASHPVVGIHCGEAAWTAICHAIPGGAYRPREDRLRRLSTHCEDSIARLHNALALYYSESARHHAPVDCAVWFWSAEPLLRPDTQAV
eukprot:195914-Amphidinium_carterae.1